MGPVIPTVVPLQDKVSEVNPNVWRTNNGPRTYPIRRRCRYLAEDNPVIYPETLPTDWDLTFTLPDLDSVSRRSPRYRFCRQTYGRRHRTCPYGSWPRTRLFWLGPGIDTSRSTPNIPTKFEVSTWVQSYGRRPPY